MFKNKKIITCKNKNDAYERKSKLDKKNMRVVARDLSENGAKEFYLTTHNEFVKLLEQDYNMYECFDDNVEVKPYIDVDDIGSKSLEESKNYVNDFLSDFKKHFKLDNGILEINSHGFCKKKQKQKYSYTFIFLNYHFDSVLHAKTAITEFLYEYPNYKDIVDTYPYLPFQTFRCANQSKINMDRKNKIVSGHTIKDSLITNISKNSKKIHIDYVKPEKKKPRTYSHRNSKNDTDLNQKSNETVYNIVCNLLPLNFAENYATWFTVSSFIYKYGSYFDYVCFSKRATREFEEEENKQKFLGFSPDFCTISTFIGYLYNQDNEMFGTYFNKKKILKEIEKELIKLQPSFEPLENTENIIEINEKYFTLDELEKIAIIISA